MRRRDEKVDTNGLNRHQRYDLRKRGLDVPKMAPGCEPIPFWSRVNKTEGCWLWTGPVDICGYGKHGDTKAHRSAWMEENGSIPEGMIVCHKCDTPACVRQSHLFLGTQADNMEDKVGKNRQARGERGGQAKLTNADVRNIKGELALVSAKELAAMFGVTSHAIWKIRRGKNWGWLTCENLGA